MGGSLSSINIPNILTILRILMTPIFVILVERKMLTYALIVFTLAGITDGLDGLIARYFNQRTSLGAFLDPIADKLLICAAFISLAILRILPPWLSIIVITRDILIVGGIAICSLHNIDININPTLISKMNTVAQLATIFFTLLIHQIHFLSQVILYCYGITAALTIVSGFQYIYLGLNLLQNTDSP